MTEQGSEEHKARPKPHEIASAMEPWTPTFKAYTTKASHYVITSTDDSGHLQHVAIEAKGDTQRGLEQEIAALKARVNEQEKALLEEQKRNGIAGQQAVEQYKAGKEHLDLAEARLSFVTSRMREEAREVFLGSTPFQDEFLVSKGPRSAFVMAVDVRRSTELMLKSRKPELFAAFIIELCNKLRRVILDHDGVFDKFTGDGILAFFPDFYTGDDAGYCAVHAASECHKVFTDHYSSHRNSFDTVLRDVGLGIGIDFGDTHLVNFERELAIVGRPVVYA